MNKYEVTMGLERLRDARIQWNAGRAEFNRGYSVTLRRLIHEAARAYLSARDMAKALDVPVKTITRTMREAGLDPKSGKRALSDAASKALIGNAELLGINPQDIDLTSPLAYLPMGEQMRKEILAVSKVTEIEGEPDGFPDGLSYEQRSFNELADAIYNEMPWEGETYQAVAEKIALVLTQRGMA